MADYLALHRRTGPWLDRLGFFDVYSSPWFAAIYLLLFVSLSVVSDSALSAALFSSGLVLVPLIAHIVFTSIVVLLRGRLRLRYAYAILAAVIVHTVYNLIVSRGIG